MNSEQKNRNQGQEHFGAQSLENTNKAWWFVAS